MPNPSTADDYRRAKAGCPHAFRRLIRDWRSWTLQITHHIRHYSTESAQILSQEDLEQEALNLFYTAIMHLNLNFSPEQCKAYIKATVKFGLRRYAEKTLRHAQECQPERIHLILDVRSFWQNLSHLDGLIAKERHQQVKGVVKKYCTPQERVYLAQRFGITDIADASSEEDASVLADVQSIKNLAEGIGISYQALRSREKSLLKRLRSLFVRHHGI
jgi:hypothetical protein